MPYCCRHIRSSVEAGDCWCWYQRMAQNAYAIEETGCHGYAQGRAWDGDGRGQIERGRYVFVLNYGRYYLLLIVYRDVRAAPHFTFRKSDEADGYTFFTFFTPGGYRLPHPKILPGMIFGRDFSRINSPIQFSFSQCGPSLSTAPPFSRLWSLLFQTLLYAKYTPRRDSRPTRTRRPIQLMVQVKPLLP